MKFLIIENEADITKLLFQALSTETDEIVVATYLSEALGILDHQSFDAILLNLTLPLSPWDTGLVTNSATYRAISDIAPNACKIIVSGGTDDDVVRMVGEDYGTYLLKSQLNVLTLRDTVIRAVNKFKTYRDAHGSINPA